MANSKIAEFADMLYSAEAGRTAIRALTDTDPSFTVADAYAVQMHNVKRWTGAGRAISGKKIGLTSKGMQDQLGVDEPDYGHLFGDMDCSGDGRVQTGKLLQPKIEAEIAFILKGDLSGGSVTAEDVLDATEYVVAAFEVVDSRIKDWKLRLPDTVADNASSGRYVLGSKRVPPRSADLSAITMEILKNGDLAGEGVSSAVLGNPSYSVAWLSNKLWEYGVTLKKGEVVLSGALSAAPAASAGDVFEARFSVLGDVTAEFV
ncbi:MAG: fumarylacetoacetate hydrolase family protein [Synergistaceae bacterium]|jgi:2-keto-4-pentenoate hydratase|nr:fumarylacetoacetate hydrolase family protein [Synergistaceae bacterium]